MAGRDTAELSAIVVTPRDLGSIAATLAALHAQTAADRIEVVIVAREPLPEDAQELEGFAAATTVTVPFESLGHAIAAGFTAASAPVVAYAEEHSQPSPEWAEVLIECHGGPWRAVGWAIENANPQTTASWAHLLTDFGPGVAPVESGERDTPLPWHHVSYRREDLVPYGERLPEAIEAEGLMQQDLLDKGARFYVDGRATSRHLNISKTRWNLRCHYLGGRGFGAARAARGPWRLPKRLAYALAFPLVPIIRMKRLRADVVRSRPIHKDPRGLNAALTINLILDAFGEAVGYLAGDGPARTQRLPMELERTNYLRTGDAPALPPAAVSEPEPISSR